MAALAAVTQPWHVLALRVVQGVFAGYGPLAMMMAADSSPREHLATSIGWVQTAQRLGPALGPVVGGVLASTVGLRETFVIASLVYLSAFLLVIVAYREVPRAPLPHQSQTEAPVTLAALRRAPHFVLAFFAVFGLQLADRSFGPILPLYLAQAGTAASRVAFLSGVIFTVSAAAAAIGNQTTSWVMRARTASRALPPAILLSAAAAVVFGVTAPIGVLLAAATVFGLGLGLATTGVYTAAGHALPPVSRGLGMSYLSTAYLLGLAVSPIVAGLIGAASMRAVFFVDAAGLAALAWALNRSGSDWGQTGVRPRLDLVPQTRAAGGFARGAAAAAAVHGPVAGARHEQADKRAGHEDRILHPLVPIRHAHPVEEEPPVQVHLPDADADVGAERDRGPACEPAERQQHAAGQLRDPGDERERRTRLESERRVERAHA
jgi:MFS family permease